MMCCAFRSTSPAGAPEVIGMIRLFPAWGIAAVAALLPLCAHAGHAYVSNEDGNTVTVIDTVRGAVIATVPVGRRPRGLKLSHDGRLLYVAVSGLPKCPPKMPDAECEKQPRDLKADGIAVVDTATRHVVDLLKAGSDPEQFDVSPDGRRLFIANEDSSTLSVIDAKNGESLASLPVGREPEGVRMSPDGRFVLVTSETDGTVSIIDAHALKVEKAVHVGVRPRDLVVTPDSTAAYVSAEADATVHRISVPAGDSKEILQLPRTDRPMGILHDAARQRLYVGTGHGGTVAIIDLAHGATLVTQVKVGARPWGIALTPDGRELYTANGPSGDVSVIDTTTDTVIRTIPVGSGPWGVVIGR
jgi:YVTN family beta-propeller protein